MARNREHVKGDTCGIASDVPAAIVDPGVDETLESGLDKSAGTEWHHACVLVRHAEFEVIEEMDVLEERARVRRTFPQATPDKSEETKVNEYVF